MSATAMQYIGSVGLEHVKRMSAASEPRPFAPPRPKQSAWASDRDRREREQAVSGLLAAP